MQPLFFNDLKSSVEGTLIEIKGGTVCGIKIEGELGFDDDIVLKSKVT